MAKVLSQAAIFALQDSLASIFWYKRDLRGFLHRIIKDGAILGGINWDDHKRIIVRGIIDALHCDPIKGSEILTQLCYEVTSFKDFHHLEILEDGAIKAKKAKDSVEKLCSLVDAHQSDEEALARREKAANDLKKNTQLRKELDSLKNNYFQMVIANDHQERGRQLERLMFSLFELFDLDPKASFSLNAEQIDGAFFLEGTDYIFEAKWQQQSVSRADLDAFQAKVNRRLDNTLGLFLAINGFSSNAVELFSSSRSGMILMDGGDLAAVLEERIDFVALLIRKKRHASSTGGIYLPYANIVSK